MARARGARSDERALLAYESDPLVTERLRLLAGAAGWATCAVDSVSLFRELRARLRERSHTDIRQLEAGREVDRL